MNEPRARSAAGRLILDHLYRLGTNQTRLAARLGWSRTMLVDVIAGRRSIPPNRLTALSEALGLTERQRNELALADVQDRIDHRERAAPADDAAA